MTTTPYQKNGRWFIDKDPDDELYYNGDVSATLADAGTVAMSVETIVAGVEVHVPAYMQDGVAIVKLGGLDVSDDPQNFCTFRITCANGERFDKTIWFKRKDN